MVAAAAIGAAGVLVLASMAGWPRQVFHFEQPRPPEELPADARIAGWASFDRDSYAIGDTTTFQVRILYRDELVEPDFDTFRRSISISPFDRRAVTERRRALPGGATEHVLEYALQGVSVEPHSTYRLNPLVLYYSNEAAPDTELQAVRIQPPPVYIGGHYPPDVSTTPLLRLKGQIRDPTVIRQTVMGISGGLLLVLAGLLLWRFGRRRRQTELSEPERLWQRFHELDPGSQSPRDWLVSCEHIFTQLLHSRGGVSPRAFWSGVDPAEQFWKDAAVSGRAAFGRIYRPEPLTDEDVGHGQALLERLFSSTVAEERLRREQEPSAFTRLRRQPAVVTVSGLFVALAAAMLILAAQPALWLSKGVAQYNQAVHLAQDDGKKLEAAGEFTALGENVADVAVRAAALYNSATITADLGLAGGPPRYQNALNEVLFQEHLSLVTMFHELEEGDRLEVLEALSKRGEALRQAEVDLKSAIRTDPLDESISRNLEIVVKHRKAVVDSLMEYLAAQEGGVEPGVSPEASKEKETLIDVLKRMELPAEHVEDAGKDDRGYHVMEHF
jgi:hypothetical protein